MVQSALSGARVINVEFREASWLERKGLYCNVVDGDIHVFCLFEEMKHAKFVVRNE